MNDLEVDVVRVQTVARVSQVPPQTWEQVQVWARAEVARMRAMPETDPWSSWKVADEERRQRTKER
jgi:hypothetical protein